MSDIDQTLCLPVLTICLGVCFVWALWEIEDACQRRHQRMQLVREARRTVLTGGE
jgi:hypothetical protein